MEYKKSTIKNSSGEKLAGIFYPNKNSGKLIIFCHGRLANKDNPFYVEICKKLFESGFNVYRFDFSGNGESEGKFEECTISKDVEDIKSAVDYFKKKNYEIFCIIGHSQGAVEVLLHQAKYDSAKCVVDISGLVDQRDMTTGKYAKEQINEINKKGFTKIKYKGKSFNISKKYFYDRAGYGDIRNEVKKIKAPILVLHGTSDEDINFENGLKMKKILKKKDKFVPVEGAGHFYVNPKHRKRLFGSIADWLEKQK